MRYYLAKCHILHKHFDLSYKEGVKKGLSSAFLKNSTKLNFSAETFSIRRGGRIYIGIYF